MKQLIGLVEIALQHLSAVLKLVQIPAGHLMPLLRLASQTIVTNGVEVLRIKALGLLLAATPGSATVWSAIYCQRLSYLLSRAGGPALG